MDMADDAPWVVIEDESGEVVDRAPTFESALETVEEYADVAELVIRYRPRPSASRDARSHVTGRDELTSRSRADDE